MKKLLFILSLFTFCVSHSQQPFLFNIPSSAEVLDIATRTVEDRYTTVKVTGYGIDFNDGNDNVSIQHEAATHTFGAGNKPVMIKTHPDGSTTKTYPDISSIPSASSYDVSGIGGGIIDGNYYFFTIVFNLSGVTQGTYVHRSTDHGSTWTVTLLTSSYRFPFGKTFKLGSKLFQTFYWNGASDSYATTYESSDNGVTWGNEVTIYSGNTSTDFVTETACIPVNTTTALAFQRMQNGTESKISYTTNSGTSWSLLGTLNGIEDVNNPANGVKWDGPIVFKNGEEVGVVWSDRFAKNLVKISVSQNYTTLSEWNNAKRCVIAGSIGLIQGAQNEFQGSDVVVNAFPYIHWHDVSVECTDPLNADAVTTDLITKRIPDKSYFFARSNTASYTGSTKAFFDVVVSDTKGGLDYSTREDYTIQKTGTYRYTANIAFASGDGSATTLSLYVNNVLVDEVSNNETNQPTLNLNGSVELSAGDVCYYQLTAGTGTRNVNTELLSNFAIVEDIETQIFSATTSATTFTNSSTKIPLTAVSDPGSMLDANTTDIHIAEDGFYRISSTLPLSSGTGSENRYTGNRVSKVTPFYTHMVRVSNNTFGTSTLSFNNVCYLRKGDVFFFDFYPIGGSRTLNTSVTDHFTIYKIK